MWYSSVELYPVHISPAQAPVTGVYTIEALGVEYKLQDYLIVQPAKAPYELTQEIYARRLWVC